MVVRSSPREPKEITGPCPFCSSGSQPDYKDYKNLKKFISERARILGRTRTGMCARHQRMLTREIKRARYLGLLPYIPQI